MNFSTKMVVATAVGATLYGVGGLPMFGIPVFANSTLKPAMAILAMFSVMFGPVVGFLVGFIGHLLTDLFAGWGLWFGWIIGSGILGGMVGFFSKFTQDEIEKGVFSIRSFLIFCGLVIAGNVIGYGCSVFLDVLLYAEPLNKVLLQLAIITTSNTIVTCSIGYFLLRLLAKRNEQSSNLSES